MRSSSERGGQDLRPGISVVVPVYNSREGLYNLVREISDSLRRYGKESEILLVNDGSSDGSWDEILRLTHENPHVKGINFSRNFGQHNATLCGLRHALYDVTITMDDDLQHPPREIPKLLEKLNEGWDVVYGIPRRINHSVIRNVLSRVTKTVVGFATGKKMVAEQNPFRALRTRLRYSCEEFMGPDLLIDVLLGWGTSRFGSVVVDHEPRRWGKTNYSAKRLYNMGILVLTAHSTAPLRFASWLGFALTGFGILILGYVLLLRIFFGSIPGFPFLASLISIFSGAQLFVLGLFGEYLTRIFNRALGHPTYVIKETTPIASTSKTSYTENHRILS